MAATDSSVRTDVPAKDKEVLRRLAGELAGIAALPVQRDKAGLWAKLNDLRSDRPMVWINEIPWHQINVNDELTLQCTDPWAAAETITSEGYVTLRQPLHTHAAGLINLLPGPVRLAGHHAATVVERLRHGPGPAHPFPAFPADRAVELLRLLVRRALGLPASPAGELWPHARPVVLLTHDVDTAEGQRCILQVARMEERLGLRSCWYVVGDRYPLDHGLLLRLRQAGHEIGLHGVLHDQRLPYLPPARLAARLDRCDEMMQRHQVQGFRSPALLMSDALWAELSRRFDYDSSVPDTDVDSVSAPHRGCSAVFPFFRGTLLELPLTLPLDDRLLLLGLSPRAMVRAWLAKIDWIRQLGGVAVVTTHVEPHLGASPALLGAYGRLLEQLCQRRQAITPLLPRQVAQRYCAAPEPR